MTFARSQARELRREAKQLETFGLHSIAQFAPGIVWK
jgi:hypothetical protein